MDFATYMPCRIAMIEDANGQGWLIMTDINVDLLAKDKKLQQELTARIKAVRNSLIEIMQAGAKGEL
jgi:flagellar basal body-associated protein FliL